MSGAARRLPMLAQRQLSRQVPRQFTRVTPRITFHTTLRIQPRYASTAAPPEPTTPGAPTQKQEYNKSGDMEPTEETVLKSTAATDPELYILLTVVLFAFGIAGFYFGRKPTSAVSERNVAIADGTMPWEVDDAEASPERFKYRYHPGGDKSKPLKDAPSALNITIVPDVTLPKRLHDRYNKWGKPESEW